MSVQFSDHSYNTGCPRRRACRGSPHGLPTCKGLCSEFKEHITGTKATKLLLLTAPRTSTAHYHPGGTCQHSIHKGREASLKSTSKCKFATNLVSSALAFPFSSAPHPLLGAPLTAAAQKIPAALPFHHSCSAASLGRSALREGEVCSLTAAVPPACAAPPPAVLSAAAPGSAACAPPAHTPPHAAMRRSAGPPTAAAAAPGSFRTVWHSKGQQASAVKHWAAESPHVDTCKMH